MRRIHGGFKLLNQQEKIFLECAGLKNLFVVWVHSGLVRLVFILSTQSTQQVEKAWLQKM